MLILFTIVRVLCCSIAYRLHKLHIELQTSELAAILINKYYNQGVMNKIISLLNIVRQMIQDV